MRTTDLENIYSALCSVFDNLKAETLLAEIEDNSEGSFDDFIITNKGTFNRAYRRDIVDIDEVLHEDKITIGLSRNGLYDILPEGLFHTPHVSKTGETYTSRRKIDKQEEQEARLFFAPLESEFFYQRLQIEKNEKVLLSNFYNLKDDFLINFWKLENNIPDSFLHQLIKLLPHAHKIAGDLALTRLCLEKILGETVTFSRKNLRKIYAYHKPTDTDDFQLGVNSVLEGEDYTILQPKLEITVGPVLTENLNTYLEQNGAMKFIEIFNNYFLPLELETEVIVKVNSEVGFLLNETQEPIMGISTYL